MFFCSRIPPNRFAFVELDALSVCNPRLSIRERSNVQIEDTAMDTFINSLVMKKPRDFHSMLVGEGRAFQFYNPETDVAPLAKHDIRTKRYVIIACALVPNHWSMLLIDQQLKKIHVLDPKYLANARMVQETRKIVRGLNTFYKVEGLLSAEFVIWPCQFQQDDLNCGAHVCYFAQQIVQGKDFDPQADMGLFREKILSEILKHLEALSPTG